jgi:hypothetical protein
MISELCNFEDEIGDIASIGGLEMMIDRIENHHAYF